MYVIEWIAFAEVHVALGYQQEFVPCGGGVVRDGHRALVFKTQEDAESYAESYVKDRQLDDYYVECQVLEVG